MERYFDQHCYGLLPSAFSIPVIIPAKIPYEDLSAQVL